jgi:hypothetical protein
VVQSPGGGVTTFAFPTAAPSPGSVFGTVDGLPISASGASVVWIGTQAVTQGGPVATISGNDVVSLGPSGLQVMKPGGAVTTLSIPPQETSSSMPLGSIIASSMCSTGFSENDANFYGSCGSRSKRYRDWEFELESSVRCADWGGSERGLQCSPGK